MEGMTALRKLPATVPLATLLLLTLAPCRAAPGEAPDVREAERELARAIADLEEIAGRKLLRGDPPPLPELPELGLSAEARALTAHLHETDPAEWTPAERERLTALLAGQAGVLSSVGARGEVLDGPLLPEGSRRLLQAAKLVALRDRLALLEGREAEVLSGLESRLDLALRMSLQPGAVGPLLGNAVFLLTVPDLQRMATRPETSSATLERLDALLGRWRAELPDAAAVLARDVLDLVDPERRTAKVDEGQVAGDDPAEPLFMAPLARVTAGLAGGCREIGCRAAVAALDRPDPDGEGYEVIATMMIPNYVDMLRKLEGSGELARLARTAVALRLEALEAGAYPDELEGVALSLGLSPEQADEMAYERRPDGEGARLRLASDRLVTDAPERRRAALRPLLAWDLPAVP